MKNFIIIIALSFLGLNAGFATIDSDNKPTKFRILAISAANDSIMSASNIITLFQPFSVEFPLLTFSIYTKRRMASNDTFGAVAKGCRGLQKLVNLTIDLDDAIFTSTDIEKKLGW